jgi:hypothetical protein
MARKGGKREKKIERQLRMSLLFSGIMKNDIVQGRA